MEKRLTERQIQETAEKIGVDPSALGAVIDVESSGSGFLADGRVKVLFEGHIFWRKLSEYGLNPAGLEEAFPDIIYPKWDKTKYSTGLGEWKRLGAAMRIHEVAALMSASYGLFQIMGFNYEECGYTSVKHFVQAMSFSEQDQLEAFCKFIDGQGMIPALKNLRWAEFARKYNGSGYAQNNYDKKLQAAFVKFKETGHVMVA